MKLKTRVEDLELTQSCQEGQIDRLLNFVNKKRNSKTSEYRGECCDLSTAFESLFNIYDNQIRLLEERVEKNENAIKAMIELCQPIIIERLSGLVGEIANGLESELKNIAVKRTKKSKTESKPTTKTTKKGVKKNV